MKVRFLLFSLLACALLLIPVAAQAQYTCGTSAWPQCDGTCPPGDACSDPGMTGICQCVPEGELPPCEAPNPPPFGPPNCWGGGCPLSQPICALVASDCVCIPTLSQWGIIFMSVAMLGGVIFLRRRRRSV